MNNYQGALARAVNSLPVGSKRLRSGETAIIAKKYGKPTYLVRQYIARLAKLRDAGRDL